jgi:hypothetical protein
LVDEGTGSDTASYSLSLAPTSDVTIQLSNPDYELTVSPSALTFTSANWQTPQTVTITAKLDSLVDDEHVAMISSVVSTTNANYQGLVLGDLSVSITDTTVPQAPTLILDMIGNLEIVDGVLIYYYQNGNNITFKGRSDPLANIKITVRSDSKICETIADSEGDWTCTSDYVENGMHTVEITATSVYGVVTIYPTLTLGVNVDLADTGNVLIESPIVGSVLIMIGIFVMIVPSRKTIIKKPENLN